MQDTDRVNMLRECSKVERAHTLPHHGSYTNGQHSFDAVMLLLVLYPEASFNLVKAVMVHDFGERWCGDIPAPAKWSDGEFAKRSEQLEARCLRAVGLTFKLTEEEHIWLKTVDIIEFMLWVKDQIAMGNMNATVVMANIVTHFKHTSLPPSAREFVKNHKWGRTPDMLPK